MWLVGLTLERSVRARALAGDTVVFLGKTPFSHDMVPLSTQAYKWVPANLMLGGNPAMV